LLFVKQGHLTGGADRYPETGLYRRAPAL